jgi:hypothetical protein
MQEAEEEAGLKIKVTKKIGTNIDNEHEFKAEMYLAEALSGQAKNLDFTHHSNVEWFRLSDLPSPLGSTTRKGLQILNSTD